MCFKTLTFFNSNKHDAIALSPINDLLILKFVKIKVALVIFSWVFF